MKYLKYILNEYAIPYTEIEKVSDLESFVIEEKITLGLVIHSFDVMAEKGFPTFPNIKYLGLFVDPIGNLDHYFRIHGNDQNLYGSIVPFMMQHQYFHERWPDKPVFSFYQGYVPYEDFADKVNPIKKDIDVLAPGFNRDVPDRNHVIAELRKRQLKVVDDRLFGDELDEAMKRAKISIYYPIFDTIRTFHGQRTLWAVNKQTCVVTLESGDIECEEFYKDVYLRIKDPDISRFCDTIYNIVQSGQWLHLGQRYYGNYRNKYDGAKIFDKCLVKFFRDFTSPFISVVNPVDERYTVSIEKYPELIPLTPKTEPVFRKKLIERYSSQLHSSLITTYRSFFLCYIWVLQILKKPAPKLKWSGLDSKDTIITTRLHQPIQNINYTFVDVSNGSLNMSLLDLEHKLRNGPIKLILVKHEYGIPFDLESIQPFLDEHKKSFGLYPVVVEDFSMAQGTTIKGQFISNLTSNTKTIGIFPTHNPIELSGGIVRWPNETWFQVADNHPIHAINEIIAQHAILNYDNNEKNYAIETANYQHLLDELDPMIHTFVTQNQEFPFQLCIQPPPMSETKICSSKFPILLVDETKNQVLEKVIDYLHKYNIECEGIKCQSKTYGITLPCGYWMTEKDIDYMLDVMEEFFDTM